MINMKKAKPELIKKLEKLESDCQKDNFDLIDKNE
jgi:hypothetical protein